VDALSRNPVGTVVEDDDFCEEVQDLGIAQSDARLEEEGALFIRNGNGAKWFGIRKSERELVQRQERCLEVNQCKHFGDHHIYMVDAEFGDERTPESVLCTIEDIGTSTIIQDSAPKGGVQRRRPQFYDRQ
jgi:hypothetical protein